jgi:hypothetical protein
MSKIRSSLEVENISINVLKKYWDKYKSGFEKKESPDWQNKKHNIGIEVTRIMTTKEGLLMQAYKKDKEYIKKNWIIINESNFGNDQIELKLKPKDNRKDYSKITCGVTIDKTGKIIYIWYDVKSGMYNDILVDIYNNKLLKLNNSFKKFKTNCLYFGSMIEDFDIDDCLNCIKNFDTREFKIKFDYIFFNECYTDSNYDNKFNLIEYNFKNQKITKFKMPNFKINTKKENDN